MADNLGDVIDQDRPSPLAQIAAAGQGLFGLSSLLNLIPSTISAANAPQFPDQPDPIRPSPVTTQMTPFIRGKPDAQSGFAVPDPNALPNVRPNSPLAANTAGIRGWPGTQSGPPGPGRPDRSYNPLLPPFPADPPDPPPPMPKPTPDSRPDLPGQPGAKEPDHTQWGVSHSPLQDLVRKYLDEQQPVRPPDLTELPKPVSQQVQNSWMSTVLSSAGLLLAAFGSRRSAAPMTAAIKSFGGYLQGYQQGQEEVWKQKQAEYKQQLDYALRRNQLELDRYKIAVEKSKGDTEKLHELLYAASIENEDDRGKAQIEQGRINEFFKYIDAKQKWWDQVTAIRNDERIRGVSGEPEPPEPELPEDLRGYIYGGGGGAGGGGALDIVKGVESSGRWNVTGPTTDSGPARGGYQITDGTWQQYAPPNVQRKWPRADLAPPEVQTEIAKTIPISRWADKTRNALHRAYGDFDENQTLGQLERQHPSGGTQVAGPGGGTTPQTGGGTTPQPAAAGQVAEDSPVAQLGRQIFRGEQPPAGTDKEEEAYASTYAQNLQKRLSAVAASGLKGQDLIDAVRKIDPDTADRLPDIVAGKEALTGTDSYSNSIETIAKKLKPGWTRGQYKASEDLREYFNKGPPGQVLLRSTGLATAAASVMEAINNLGTDDQNVIHNRLSELFATGFSGDARFQALLTALNQYDIESTAVAMGGTPRVALINTLAGLTPAHSSPAALRQIILTNLRGDNAKIDGIIAAYRRNYPGQGDPPLLDAEGHDAATQLVRYTDPRTGRINLPDDKLSPLLTRAQRQLSQQDQDALDWARKNPNDPRAAQILQHLGAQ